jgi:hypothetical protein
MDDRPIILVPHLKFIYSKIQTVCYRTMDSIHLSPLLDERQPTPRTKSYSRACPVVAVSRSYAAEWSRVDVEGTVSFNNGEDGIIARIFELLPPPLPPASSLPDPGYTASSGDYWCIDVGAWDGCHLSNTHSLLVSSTSSSSSSAAASPSDENEHKRAILWHGVLIEANQERFQKLKDLHDPLGNVSLNISVSVTNPDKGLDFILRGCLVNNNTTMKLPRQLDFVCIDIDGGDYWLLHDFLHAKNFRPRVICIEFNPTMPDDLIYIPIRSDVIRHGASLAAIVELAEAYGYILVETTLYNAFLVDRPLYEKYLSHEVKDTSIEALHEITMGTSVSTTSRLKQHSLVRYLLDNR